MTAAIRAAQRGKKVTVLEKTNETGGTLSLTAGHLSGAASVRQQQAGIDDSVEEHFKDIARICRNTMDPVITRKAVELAPATINWLAELGYPFHDRAPAIIYGHEAYSKARTYFGKEDVQSGMQRPGQTIRNLLIPVWDKQVQLGNIRLIKNCQLQSIQTSGNQVTGVQALQHNQLLTLQASRYVLTTGGYAANSNFFASNTPGTVSLKSAANPASTGDGIAAALSEIGRAHV